MGTTLEWANGTTTTGGPAFAVDDGEGHVLLGMSSRHLFDGDVPLVAVHAWMVGRDGGDARSITLRHSWGEIGPGGEVLGIRLYQMSWFFAVADDSSIPEPAIAIDPRDAPEVGEYVRLWVAADGNPSRPRSIVARVSSLPEDHVEIELPGDDAATIPPGTPVVSAATDSLVGIVHSVDARGPRRFARVAGVEPMRRLHLGERRPLRLRDAWRVATAARTPYNPLALEVRDSDELIGGPGWMSRRQIGELVASLVQIAAISDETQHAFAALRVFLRVERGRVPDELFEDLQWFQDDERALSTRIAIVLTRHPDLLASVCPEPEAVFHRAAALEPGPRTTFLWDNCRLSLFESKDEYVRAIGFGHLAELVLRAIEETGAVHPLERELLRKLAGT